MIFENFGLGSIINPGFWHCILLNVYGNEGQHFSLLGGLMATAFSSN